MAWDDKPSDAQIDLFWHWGKWNISNDILRPALKWLKDNSTRRTISTEMGRIRELYKSHKLNKDTFFDSDIWNDYKVKEED